MAMVSIRILRYSQVMRVIFRVMVINVPM